MSNRNCLMGSVQGYKVMLILQSKAHRVSFKNLIKMKLNTDLLKFLKITFANKGLKNINKKLQLNSIQMRV